ncbi:hypothetical protein D046_2598B, partial [Vibrio parahaemolyticus V-223/04]
RFLSLLLRREIQNT